MTMLDSAELLKLAGLKKTDARMYILDTIRNTEWALSHKELEDNAPQEMDRVTIYRCLNSFEEKGLIHKIVDETGVAHYAICSHQCHDHLHHDDNHIHFQCVDCEKIYCLDDFGHQQFSVPEGFKVEKMQLKMTGKCKNCH